MLATRRQQTTSSRILVNQRVRKKLDRRFDSSSRLMEKLVSVRHYKAGASKWVKW
jgi:hypothetical protein